MPARPRRRALAALAVAVLAPLAAGAGDGAGLRPQTVKWSVEARVHGVESVFAHPTVAGRVAVSSGAGLVLSRDAGATWEPLAREAAGRLGRVNDVLYLPASPDSFYVSTEANGLWFTSDGGRTLRRAASRQTGLASDSVLAVFPYPDDPDYRTLLAVHGDKAAGISRSDDGGRTWRVIARPYHVRKLLHARWKGQLVFLMIASRTDEPELVSVWSSPGLSEFWYEIARDVQAVDATPSMLDKGAAYFTTIDRGLFRLTTGWSSAGVRRVGPEDADEWATVGVTWGSRPGVELVYGYEPRRLGLVVSEDGMKTFTSHRDGLLVGPFVREGACVGASANGSVFYAAVNGRLYVGRTGGGRSLSDVEVEPAAFSYARGAYLGAKDEFARIVRDLPRQSSAAAGSRGILRCAEAMKDAFHAGGLVVRARVHPAGAAAQAVTVDLRPLGGPAAEPMRDDGLHGDAEAGDGVYGAKVLLSPVKVIPDRWAPERDVEGGVGLWVTAVRPGGERASAPAILAAMRRPETFVFWNERGGWVNEAEGKVSCEEDRSPGAAREGDVCMKVTAGPGPWRMSYGDPYRVADITGRHALSLWLRADAPAGAVLNVHISDNPENTFPTATPPVRIAEGGGKGEWRRVVVPFARLLEGVKGFQPSQTTYVLLSGDGPAAATWRLDDIRFFVTEAELARDVERAREDQR